MEYLHLNPMFVIQKVPVLNQKPAFAQTPLNGLANFVKSQHAMAYLQIIQMFAHQMVFAHTQILVLVQKVGVEMSANIQNVLERNLRIQTFATLMEFVLRQILALASMETILVHNVNIPFALENNLQILKFVLRTGSVLHLIPVHVSLDIQDLNVNTNHALEFLHTILMFVLEEARALAQIAVHALILRVGEEMNVNIQNALENYPLTKQFATLMEIVLRQIHAVVKLDQMEHPCMMDLNVNIQFATERVHQTHKFVRQEVIASIQILVLVTMVTKALIVNGFHALVKVKQIIQFVRHMETV